MRRLFDQELDELDAGFTEMGMQVSATINHAVDTFINHDLEGAKVIVARDHEINEKEVALETQSFEMIALYQPVTSDLREVVTILKAVSDLERAADHARNVAKATIHVKGKQRVAEIESTIATMGQKTAQMVSDVLAAYVKEDEKAARKLAKVGGEINDLNHVVRDAAYGQMRTDPDVLTAASIYVNVSNDLNRIADYLVNVCEWIIYLISGEIVELGSDESTEDPED